MLRLTNTLEVVWVVLRLHHMEERQNHTMTNAENESEHSLRERREKQHIAIRARSFEYISSSSDPTVSLEYPAHGETQDLPGLYL